MYKKVLAQYLKFGLSKEEYQYILEAVVKPLKKENVQVFCFGSRARGDYKKFSDLDLLLVFDQDNIERHYMRRKIGIIQEKLELENFPYLVDLVWDEDLAKNYKDQFNQEKILF